MLSPDSAKSFSPGGASLRSSTVERSASGDFLVGMFACFLWNMYTYIHYLLLML